MHTTTPQQSTTTTMGQLVTNPGLFTRIAHLYLQETNPAHPPGTATDARHYVAITPATIRRRTDRTGTPYWIVQAAHAYERVSVADHDPVAFALRPLPPQDTASPHQQEPTTINQLVQMTGLFNQIAHIEVNSTHPHTGDTDTVWFRPNAVRCTATTDGTHFELQPAGAHEHIRIADQAPVTVTYHPVDTGRFTGYLPPQQPALPPQNAPQQPAPQQQQPRHPADTQPLRTSPPPRPAHQQPPPRRQPPPWTTPPNQPPQG